MDSEIARQFLSDQVPLRYRRLIAPALKRAYSAVDSLMGDTPMLQVESARDNRGRLISFAVDFAIKGLIDSGEWPVDYRWSSFARPTGRYLEVRLSHSTMSISQVSDSEQQPRDVVFRANARLGNQMYLQLPEFEDEAEVKGQPAFLLIHGHRDLAFAHIGVPNRFHQSGYLYRTPNLMTMLYEVAPSDLPPPESAIDVEKLLTLKEEIEKWQHDNP